jgi:hypothetical protein
VAQVRRPGPQQVEEHLRAGLPGSDDRDVLRRQQPVAGRQVVGRVQHGRAGERDECRWERRHGPHTEHHIARQHGAARLDVQPEHPVLDGQSADPPAEPATGELPARPRAVGVVLGARDVEPLGEVEREQPASLTQVTEERQRVGGFDQGHQIGEERHLQERALDHQPGMPAELRLPLEERGAQPVHRSGERGERQVRRPDADTDQVQHLTHLRRWR